MQKTAPKPPVFSAIFMAFGVGILPISALAFAFDFPAPASQSYEKVDALTSFALPIGPFAKGAMQTDIIEGAVAQTAWVLQAKGLTTLQILAPLREQLIKRGYTVLYECETFVCGGFDFRFASDIAAEPAMHVDLGDFRYLAVKKTSADGPDHIAVIVSRSSSLGFVQVTQIGKAETAPSPLITPPLLSDDVNPSPAVTPNSTPMATGLEKEGSVALDDLIFGSGAADLAQGEYASLEALADYLQTNPANKVTLVGHTDASGGLAGNIALSRERAASVRRRMIESYEIPENQITADGVGYLAPRDSNLTEEGRTRNRRVEVMLLVNP